ncbi:flippase [Neobacillus sp. GCM10023253]|uniref:flippase n=1 Tax=Neobacillus sp. GCM10023253 TaxID=3252644 RepID=UPI00360F7E03
MKINNKIAEFLKRIKGNEVAAKTINNASWLVGDKIFTMVIGVLVMALVARYLGPENYGKYNYALAFVTLFTTLSTLGLDTLSVKSIVQQDEEEGTILCTGLVLRVIGGIVLTILSSVIIKFIEPDESLIHSLVMIMSLTMVFKSLEVIEYWIQAYQKSKISSLIRMVVYVFTALLKIAFVLLEGGLLQLALIYMLDALIIGTSLVIVYFKKRTSHSKWKFRFQYAKSILSQSWYMILSGLMGTLYMQIDKVMLGSMLINKEELGVFSAATQIASMWYFVPMAVITSFKPVIMKNKKISEESYLKSVKLSYTIVAWMGIGFGVLILLFSDIIIGILFGSNYSKAAGILSVSVWAGTFAMLGSARGTWLISEELQKYSVIYIGGGCIINIILNYFLIPVLGGYGAAIATLVTQIAVSLIIPAFFKKTTLSVIMMLEAFNIKKALKYIKRID